MKHDQITDIHDRTSFWRHSCVAYYKKQQNIFGKLLTFYHSTIITPLWWHWRIRDIPWLCHFCATCLGIWQEEMVLVNQSYTNHKNVICNF